MKAMKHKHMVLIGVLLGAGVVVGIGAVATQRMADDDVVVSIDAVPAAVKATILAEAQGNVIQEIEAETENGVTIYEAEVLIDGKETDILVAADGTLLAAEVDDEDEEADDDDEDEEDEDEADVKVSLADLPEAVRATLDEVAPGAEIKDLELETEDGRSQYAVDAVIDGQVFDIEIAPDGTLLQKELEAADDD
jgi:uncharacterized membrane protein YkoI